MLGARSMCPCDGGMAAVCGNNEEEGGCMLFGGKKGGGTKAVDGCGG